MYIRLNIFVIGSFTLLKLTLQNNNLNSKITGCVFQQRTGPCLWRESFEEIIPVTCLLKFVLI